MATEKKLLVRTPRTSDGRNPDYDDKRQVIYTETVVEPYAKKFLESENATRPTVLRHEFEEVQVEVEEGTGKTIIHKAAKTAPSKDGK